MTATPRIVTAQELDQMTPNERAAAFDGRVVRNLDALLPSERSGTGAPSTADFLLYEIPLIIERLTTTSREPHPSSQERTTSGC